MPETTVEMQEDSIALATTEEADLLADLYAKLFQATGYSVFASPGRRRDLVEWIQEQCEEGKLWVVRDCHGPITLGHFEADLRTAVAIVTCDGMEGNGYGAKILSFFAKRDPQIRICPVTDGGFRLARKCGFSKEKGSECTWILSSDANDPPLPVGLQ